MYYSLLVNLGLQFLQEETIDPFVIYTDNVSYSHMREVIVESLYSHEVESLESNIQVFLISLVDQE